MEGRNGNAPTGTWKQVRWKASVTSKLPCPVLSPGEMCRYVFTAYHPCSAISARVLLCDGIESHGWQSMRARCLASVMCDAVAYVICDAVVDYLIDYNISCRRVHHAHWHFHSFLAYDLSTTLRSEEDRMRATAVNGAELCASRQRRRSVQVPRGEHL